MKRSALFVVAAALQAADPVTDAMRHEMERARGIVVRGLEAPYFIEYTVEDVDGFSVGATLGGVVSERRSRMRVPRIRVRVGDYKFDNTNYIGAFAGPFDSLRLTIDPAYGPLRRSLWLATDGTYKAALEAIARKRAALKNLALAEQINDFAKAEPVMLEQTVAAPRFDQTGWTALVRGLSAIFKEFPLRASSVDLDANHSVRRLINTEGASVRDSADLLYLRARATAQAPDGMTVRDWLMYHNVGFGALPSKERLESEAKALAAGVAAMARAPRIEIYSGPVLFEGMAGAQLAAEILGENFRVPRRPVTEPGRPGQFPFSELEGRLGARILPETFDVYDDPTVREYQGRRLLGHYEVDLEGVKAQRVSLVEKGVLKRFLMTRQPIRGFEGSNGHARLPGNFGAAEAAVGNLFVKSSEAVPVAELKKKLLEICQQRGKPYGIIVRKMDFPSSATFEEVRTLLSAQSGGRAVSLPLRVYRVFPDGREELVRGVRFRGLNARSFKDVIAAGDDETVFEFLDNSAPFALMGAGSYVAESAVIAPSLLIDDLELHRMEEELPKLPVAPAPSLTLNRGSHGDL